MWRRTRRRRGPRLARACCLRLIYAGQKASWVCYTQVLPELQQVVFYAVCPVTVPSPLHQRLAGLLSRINVDLTMGNFELNFNHGVIRFRVGLDVTDVGLSPLLFRIVVYQNLAVKGLYLPDPLAAIANGATGSELAAKVALPREG